LTREGREGRGVCPGREGKSCNFVTPQGCEVGVNVVPM